MAARRSRKGLEGAELASVATTFRTLSDPTRLRILSLLGESESCVHELCAETGMSQPAVSHQLRILRVAGLARFRRIGREVFYSLDDDHVLALVEQARRHADHLGRRPDGHVDRQLDGHLQGRSGHRRHPANQGARR